MLIYRLLKDPFDQPLPIDFFGLSQLLFDEHLHCLECKDPTPISFNMIFHIPPSFYSTTFSGIGRAVNQCTALLGSREQRVQC